MAWNYPDYHGEPPRYVCYPEPAFVRDGKLHRPWYDLPVAFRQPPFYDDDFIRNFRHHAPDLGHPGLVPREQVLMWGEGESGAGPWWQYNSDFPHGGHYGHPVFVVDDCGHHRHPELHHSEQTLEFYVPLCCDDCERRVKDYLNRSPGVESITADQWEKKVVVVGRNLRHHDLLRGLQRNLRMPRSVFWKHRPR